MVDTVVAAGAVEAQLASLPKKEAVDTVRGEDKIHVAAEDTVDDQVVVAVLAVVVMVHHHLDLNHLLA